MKKCCANCFRDYAIKKFIQDKCVKGTCDYCKSKRVYICDINILADFLREGIYRAYNMPEDVPWGYGGITTDTEDVFDYHDIFEDYSVFGLIVDDLKKENSELEGPWYPKDYDKDIDKEHEKYNIIYSYLDEWERFATYVKYEKRFTIFQNKYSQEFSMPNGTKISEEHYDSQVGFISRFENYLEDLIKVIEPGTFVYRGRINNTAKKFKHKDLTSCPAKSSGYNRMSPSGFSYFYGAEDIETCIAELRPNLKSLVTVGKFRVEKPLTLLDLAELPGFKSIFDPTYKFDVDPFLSFLSNFAAEISKSINPDEEIIEYVPTQVFTECIKENSSGPKFDGIRFISSINRGGVNWVLFKDESISLGVERWLKYMNQSHHRVKNISYITDQDKLVSSSLYKKD